jgi:hypothetical protein
MCVAGNSPLPADGILRGVVSNVHRVGLGMIHETARMEFDFREVDFQDGRAYPVHARLTSIENARERVDSHGAVRGIRATAALSNRAGQRLALLALGHPALMLPLFALENGFFHFPDPEIELVRGASLHLAVEFPPELSGVSPCSTPQEFSERDWSELHSLVNSMPYWSYSKRQPQPMDLINLIYVGSQDEIQRAFAAAGWIGSRPNSVHAGIKAIRAIAEHRALADAPMRMLLLEGEEPDLQLQKSLDTFEKRDHLRIWARDRELNGRAVWASAATRDLAAVFSLRPFGFTHQIQNDIDLERDEVVSDLSFTGCVDSVAYVSRPETVRTSGESYRKGVLTDSRVAIVTLNSCKAPRQDLSDTGSFTQPGLAVRWIRRVMLTARNHYLRDNMAWRAGEAVRFAYRAARGWNQERENEKLAQAFDDKLAANPALRRDYAVDSKRPDVAVAVAPEPKPKDIGLLTRATGLR